MLLQDHSIVNCRDESLSTELHQACRLGLVQHVEHLLFYRCDINARNQNGNTSLHICATTNQVNLREREMSRVFALLLEEIKRGLSIFVRTSRESISKSR